MVNKILCFLVIIILFVGLFVTKLVLGLLFVLTGLLWLISLAVFTNAAFERTCSCKSVADVLSKSMYVILTAIVLTIGNAGVISMAVAAMFFVLLITDLLLIKIPYKDFKGSRYVADDAIKAIKMECSKCALGQDNNLIGSSNLKSKLIKSLALVPCSVVSVIISEAIGVVFGGELDSGLLILTLIFLMCSILWILYHKMTEPLQLGKMFRVIMGVSTIATPSTIMLTSCLASHIDIFNEFGLYFYLMGIGGSLLLVVTSIKSSQKICAMLKRIDELKFIN